ncbi:Gfo/Idh/MocA family protein [Halomarina salina]|uniref:Gfo/Idh/MocA family protein n=1 Tax=Halomarina salina TaxID=1872699 RepID=A0ABD5RT86_9EURY|nr:Gfo/Idh/MocA family oxidoreductase [Halomarina salina]
MSEYTVAVIGTGPDPANPTVQGFAMGYRHAEAYRNDDRCRLVACADVVPENGRAFAEEFDVAADHVYEDYQRLVAEVSPDIVSVCVPPAIHEDIVVGCATSGAVGAIHCEKPMAHTWASAQRMVQTCWRRGVQLTFNRQRRFGKPFTEAKRLLDEGAVGPLRRVEVGWGDFYDTGAHTVDLAGMFNDEHPAEWVIAQLDYREEDLRFGAHQENQMWAQWRYENGVHGVLSTGEGSSLVDAALALHGADGTIRIDVRDGPMLDVRRDGTRETVDVDGETMHGTPADEGRFGSQLQDRSVGSVVHALDTGEESPLSGRIGLNTAEILFGGYESVRRRARVDLPLDVDDNPFEAMVADGDLTPEPADD